MDFLNHRVGDMVLYQVFSPFSFTVYSNRTVEKLKRLREFKEIEISRQKL
jgi:hypothetical protein